MFNFLCPKYWHRSKQTRVIWKDEKTCNKKICRKVAKKYVENPSLEDVVVTKADLDEYLGKIDIDTN